MYDNFILVDENNAIINRTKNYACEKKWYTFKSLRPQKAALKAYNSICYHNSDFKKNDTNFTFLNFDKNEIYNTLVNIIQLNDNFDQNLKNEYIDKILNLNKITKSLFIYVRKISSNKCFGYFISSTLNLNPNHHELKNKIIIKTKSKKISNINDQIGLQPNEYIPFL